MARNSEKAMTALARSDMSAKTFMTILMMIMPMLMTFMTMMVMIMTMVMPFMTILMNMIMTSGFSRWRKAKEEEEGNGPRMRKRRPYLASECDNIGESEIFRQQVGR